MRRPRPRVVVVVAAVLATAAAGAWAAWHGPAPPERFWVRVSGPVGRGRTTRPGLYAAPDGPTIPGCADLEVAGGCEMPTSVSPPATWLDGFLVRHAPGLRIELRARRRFLACEVATTPAQGAADEDAMWACFVPVPEEVPRDALPSADLVGMWIDEGRDWAWALYSDGRLSYRQGTTRRPGRWGARDEVVYLRLDDEPRCEIRVLAPDRTSWGLEDVVLERRVDPGRTR